MAAKYPEDDQQSKYNVQLCQLDQKKSGSCRPLSCYDLHICRDYLLKHQCSEFESNGKCSHSHSLFTQHNQRILQKKLNLSAKDEKIFEKISQLIKDSEILSRSEQSSLSNDDHRFDSTDKETSHMSNGRSSISSPTHGSVVLRKISSDAYDRSSLPLCHFSSINPDHSRHSISNSMNFSSNLNRHPTVHSIDVNPNQIDRQENKKQSPMTTHSFDTYRDDKNNNHSSFVDDIDENNDAFSMSTTTSKHGRKFAISTVRHFLTGKKEKSPTKSDLYNPDRSYLQLKYVFHRYSQTDELSYLFGPIRQYLNKYNGFQILPSGYCRFANVNEEKEIDNKLQISLPITLRTNRIQLINDEFTFLISTCAAEKIFEQNQISYSIISEPYKATLYIEVIQEIKNNHIRSRSAPSRHISSSRLSSNTEKFQMSTDGKLRIPVTKSSIDVTCGDMTQMQVGLMVCVTTSMTLLDSVLSKAGPTISAEYNQKSRSQNPLILHGGLTNAKKILFIAWELIVDSSNTIKAQQSLANLVKECIDQAYQLNMTSICFPSIGTGKIGLDPNTVSEIMINAAVDCLDKYKMDVLFVIYPSSGNDPKHQSYRAFRTCLDNLGKQTRSSRVDTSSIIHVPIEKSQQIRRDVTCKHISIVSDPSKTPIDYKYLMGLLETLIVEQIFDLSLVQKTFLDQVDLLIDLCLAYHVLPRIDFVKRQLRLRGDQESCLQCFTNLRNRRSINKYSMFSKTERKVKEIKMNTYVSMKIDEGFDNEKSKIRIEDDEKTVFDIDLKNLIVRIDGEREDFNLYTKRLNADSKIPLPRSWSYSHMIRTTQILGSAIYSLDFLNTFEQTMPKNECRILQIDAIENWPLYVRYTRKKDKDEITAFHGCSYSSVQSIIHYGLHSYYKQPLEKSIHLTRNALNSHIRCCHRSTDGKYYMFVVQLSKKFFNQDSAYLSNEDAHLFLPTHLIVYQR